MLTRTLIPLLAALPALAFRLPSAQEAFGAADSLLHASAGAARDSNNPSTIMSAASDIDLSSVGEAGDGFVRITSARHPKHSVRIKETTGWCDPDVRSYTGCVLSTLAENPRPSIHGTRGAYLGHLS